MARYLQRVGAFAVRRRRSVLLGWLAILVALFAFAVLGAGSFADSSSIPGSPAQRSLDQMDRAFPSPDGGSAQIVFTAPPGHRLDERGLATALHATVAAAAHVDGVTSVSDPLTDGPVTKDGRTAEADVQLTALEDDVTPATLDGLTATAKPSTAAGMDVHVGGDAYAGGGAPVGLTEGVGLLVALIVLVITLGSLRAAGLPLLTAIIGIAGTFAGMMGFASLVGIPDSALTLSVMLGLAVGIDYALFIVSRHRTQLAGGMAVDASIARSVATAGGAVVFAGVTVMIALAGLTVANVPMLTGMGLSAAGAVGLAVLLALSLVPALLGFAGERLVPAPGSRTARRLACAADPGGRPPLGARWVGAITAHPVRATIACVLLLGTMAVPAAQLKLALTDNGSEPASSPARQTYDRVADAFGPGTNGPLVVLVTGDSRSAVQAAAGSARDQLGSAAGVAAVSGVDMADAGDAARVVLTPTTGPTDPHTKDLVTRLQADAATVARETGASVAVTGQTAVDIDVAKRLGEAVVPFTIVVVGLSFLLLMLAFRSIWIPLKATGGFLLSVGAAFGAAVAVFQWGWLAGPLGISHEGPVASFMPTIVMAVLFGLAMDYEVFLVSSIREEYHHGGDARGAIVRGARSSARVVTAAAVIMVAVFASFLTTTDADIKAIAFTLAVGVLVDAFVVRMTLVPAVLALLGERAWWLPRWLDRRLPDVDIEGAKLERIAA
jgi:RND superfamily putative drug exporter